MVCNSCKGEFDNINGLKFCPYCGTKIEEAIGSQGEEAQEDQEASEKKDTIEEEAKRNDKFDTKEMPVITKEQIEKYKKERFFKVLATPFKKLKVVITIATAALMIALGVFGYIFLVGRPVDEGVVKQDIIGKKIMLPKGTSIEIEKNFIRSFSIKERNTDKGEKKDDIKAEVTLDNGAIEVNTLLAIHYLYEGKNIWRISDKIELAGDVTVKPLVGMDEKQIIDAVKKTTISIGETSKSLSDNDVKTLAIASRKSDYDNLKEEIIVDAGIDSGLIAASGKLKCSLIFENETWSISTIERNSNEDFVLELSPAFSQEKVLEAVKKDSFSGTAASSNVFGGKGFYISDNFTKSTSIAEKNFDAQSQNLNVTIKKQNTAGAIKSVVATDYTFAVSFDKIELINKSKTTVESVEVNDISKDVIISTIANAEIEGNNLLFWYYDKHKITPDEAKTFKTNKVASKKGFDNVKYVYGSITYKDGQNWKSTSIVAVYYLVYDKSKGYNWKLDRIVGENSPNYKMYVPELQ